MKLKEVPYFVLTACTVMALYFAFIKSMEFYLDRPTVYRSWSTQEVVKIENAEGDSISVESIPERFRLVWVK